MLHVLYCFDSNITVKTHEFFFGVFHAVSVSVSGQGGHSVTITAMFSGIKYIGLQEVKILQEVKMLQGVKMLQEVKMLQDVKMLQEVKLFQVVTVLPDVKIIQRVKLLQQAKESGHALQEVVSIMVVGDCAFYSLQDVQEYLQPG